MIAGIARAADFFARATMRDASLTIPGESGRTKMEKFDLDSLSALVRYAIRDNIIAP